MASKQNAMPPCPLCGQSKDVVGNISMDLFRCTKCGATFDTEDDGGNFFTDPTKRLEIADERRHQRRKRA